MNNFWQRALTGALFVLIMVEAILWGGWFLHITFGLIAFFGLFEFYGLFKNTEVKPQLFTGLTFGMLLYSACISSYQGYGRRSEMLILIVILVLFVSLGIIELFRNKKKPFENIAVTCFGIFYVVIPCILLNGLAAPAGRLGEWYEPWNALSVFILIWSNDTFAYLTGRLIGKHKLFERISPKKTWEGFIGGVVFAIIAGILIAYFLEENYVKFIIYALVVGVIGTLGDLAESMLKRSVDVKDSGTILPGHGGILDRFDAVLFVVPVIFLLDVIIFPYYHIFAQ